MRAYGGAVGLYADNIVAGQGALVHTGRGDPDISLVVHNGQVAAGGGGHALVVDTLHKHNQLVSRMNIINVHNRPPVEMYFCERGCLRRKGRAGGMPLTYSVRLRFGIFLRQLCYFFFSPRDLRYFSLSQLAMKFLAASLMVERV